MNYKKRVPIGPFRAWLTELIEEEKRRVMSSISTEEAEDILYTNVIARQEISKHRWYTRELIVFEEKNDLMGFYYLNPATEEQEGQDRFDSDPVVVFPVDSREVTRTVYSRREDVKA